MFTSSSSSLTKIIYNMIGEGDRLSSSQLVLPRELAQPKHNLSRYCSIFVCLLTFSLICSGIVVTVFSWFGLFREGFAWNASKTLFNYHPTFMTLGVIVVPTFGVLSYRIFPFGRCIQKAIHSCAMLASFAFIIIAVVAIEQSKFTLDHTHFWSIHTWCGLITLIAVTTQFVCGILFIFPFNKLRKLQDFVIEWHRCSGLVILWIATVTVLAGVSEYLNMGVSENWLNYDEQYSNYAPEGILGNSFCILVLLNSVLLTMVMVGPGNKYIPKTED